MKLTRCLGAAIALGLWCVAASAAADDYPSRPIRIIVPYPAGGTTDVLARFIADDLKQEFGQTVLVENRPGAATQIGADVVTRAPADGHTLLMATTSTMSLNPVVFTKLTYRPEDLTAVALVAKVPFVMDVAPHFPAQTVAEVVAYAKRNPGKVAIATVGPGTSGHLIAEVFRAAAGIDVLMVPYRGGSPALADILGDHVQLYFDGIVTSLPAFRENRMKILGVTSETRVASLPTVPTFIEGGLPSVVGYTWYGLVTRAGTPPATIRRLNETINRFLATKNMQERLLADGSEPGNLSPDEFSTMIAAERENLRKVVAPLNLKLD